MFFVCFFIFLCFFLCFLRYDIRFTNENWQKLRVPANYRPWYRGVVEPSLLRCSGSLARQWFSTADVRGQDSGWRDAVQRCPPGQQGVEPSDQGHQVDRPRGVQMHRQHFAGQEKNHHATHQRYSCRVLSVSCSFVRSFAVHFFVPSFLALFSLSLSFSCFFSFKERVSIRAQWLLRNLTDSVHTPLNINHPK